MTATKLLSVREAAARLHVSMSLVRKLLRAEELAVVRVGARVLLEESDLESYLAAHRSGGQVVELAAARGGR